jgi:hypothetical protein
MIKAGTATGDLALGLFSRLVAEGGIFTAGGICDGGGYLCLQRASMLFSLCAVRPSIP